MGPERKGLCFVCLVGFVEILLILRFGMSFDLLIYHVASLQKKVNSSEENKHKQENANWKVESEDAADGNVRKY